MPWRELGRIHFSGKGEETVFCRFWIQPELDQAELIKRLISWTKMHISENGNAMKAMELDNLL